MTQPLIKELKDLAWIFSQVLQPIDYVELLHSTIEAEIEKNQALTAECGGRYDFPTATLQELLTLEPQNAIMALLHNGDAPRIAARMFDKVRFVKKSRLIGAMLVGSDNSGTVQTRAGFEEGYAASMLLAANGITLNLARLVDCIDGCYSAAAQRIADAYSLELPTIGTQVGRYMGCAMGEAAANKVDLKRISDSLCSPDVLGTYAFGLEYLDNRIAFYNGLGTDGSSEKNKFLEGIRAELADRLSKTINHLYLSINQPSNLEDIYVKTRMGIVSSLLMPDPGHYFTNTM